MFVLLSQCEIHSITFVHNVTPFIKTCNFKREKEGISYYCSVKSFSELHVININGLWTQGA